MRNDLLIRDETLTGLIEREERFSFSDETITIKEIIAERVKSEIKRKQNIDSLKAFQNVREVDYNKGKTSLLKEIDIESHIHKAYALFDGGQIIVLVNNHQAESLDEKIEIMSDKVVSFLKLVPLVGG